MKNFMTMLLLSIACVFTQSVHANIVECNLWHPDANFGVNLKMNVKNNTIINEYTQGEEVLAEVPSDDSFVSDLVTGLEKAVESASPSSMTKTSFNLLLSHLDKNVPMYITDPSSGRVSVISLDQKTLKVVYIMLAPGEFILSGTCK